MFFGSFHEPGSCAASGHRGMVKQITCGWVANVQWLSELLRNPNKAPIANRGIITPMPELHGARAYSAGLGTAGSSEAARGFPKEEAIAGTGTAWREAG